MDDVEKVFLLQRVDVFRGVRSDHLGLLAGIAQVVDAGPGAVLMRDEDIPDALFVIARGEVTLRSTGGKTVTVKDGAGFGALGLIGERPAMLTATVPGPASARLLRITRPALADLLVDSPELTVALLRGMAHRVDTLVAQMPIHSPMAFA
jgi:CRP-like cAMP-binding protein